MEDGAGREVVEWPAVECVVVGATASVSEEESMGVRVPGVVGLLGRVVKGSGRRRDVNDGDGGSGVGGRL